MGWNLGRPLFGVFWGTLLSARWTTPNDRGVRAYRMRLGAYYCVVGGINPSSIARTTPWVRSEVPSLRMMCCTWVLAVLLAIPSFRAISALLSPAP